MRGVPLCMPDNTTSAARRPSRQRQGLREGRAPFEFGSLMVSAPLLSLLPRGDGHPVLVIPGLAADDASTLALRGFITRWGYPTYGWGLGRNAGRSHGLADRFREISERHDRPVSLIGQSLGGVFARELARQEPQRVRQVITLGSPFRGAHRTPPPVPTTAIYSRSDAVVPWRACVDDPAPGHENVEVDTSHIGMAVHPRVVLEVGRRLRRPPVLDPR